MRRLIDARLMELAADRLAELLVCLDEMKDRPTHDDPTRGDDEDGALLRELYERAVSRGFAA